MYGGTHEDRHASWAALPRRRHTDGGHCPVIPYASSSLRVTSCRIITLNLSNAARSSTLSVAFHSSASSLLYASCGFFGAFAMWDVGHYKFGGGATSESP